MRAVPLPPNEDARLRALHRLSLLDSPPEAEYDAIARLAAHICQAPIAIVDLIDEQRVFFKAAVGIEGTESPREHSVCTYTILQSGVLEVPDMSEDPRFCDIPAVTDGNMRFYAGAPVSTSDGFRLGAVCVVDYAARELTPEQHAALLALAHQVGALLELRKVGLDLSSRNRFIRHAFGRYVSEEIANNLLASPEGLRLGGQKRKVTILMSDLRGFTPMVEMLSPDQVVTLLNHYLGVMAEVIGKYRGTIDEFIGDSVLAMFGAPESEPDDALRAVACAVDMQRAMAEVNAFNRENHLPQIEMGVTVHTGEAVVGNIGSAKRAKYGVIGSLVNLASRIESYTVGGQILISDSTLHEAGGAVIRGPYKTLTMKGYSTPVTVCEVLGVAAPFNVLLVKESQQRLALSREIPVEYTLLDGKHLTDAVSRGALVQLSDKEAVLRAADKIELASNIKFTLLDARGERVPAPLYAKVMERLPGSADLVIRFTAHIPDAAAQLLQAALRASERIPVHAAADTETEHYPVDPNVPPC